MTGEKTHPQDREIILENGNKVIAYPHANGGMVNSKDFKTIYQKQKNGRYKVVPFVK